MTGDDMPMRAYAMEHGAIIGIAPCFCCKQPFAFDPDRVQAVPIDPETGRPPDMGGDPQRAVNQPLCPGCCTMANPQRKAAGLPLFDETDTAAEFRAALIRNGYGND